MHDVAFAGEENTTGVAAIATIQNCAILMAEIPPIEFRFHWCGAASKGVGRNRQESQDAPSKEEISRVHCALPYAGQLRLTDVKEMFLQMRDQA